MKKLFVGKVVETRDSDTCNLCKEDNKYCVELSRTILTERMKADYGAFRVDWIPHFEEERVVFLLCFDCIANLAKEK